MATDDIIGIARAVIVATALAVIPRIAHNPNCASLQPIACDSLPHRRNGCNRRAAEAMWASSAQFPSRCVRARCNTALIAAQPSTGRSN
jgi:hypothetical protein